MGKEKGKWTAGETDVYVGRRNLLRRERHDGGNDHCGQQRRLADTGGEAENIGGKV